MARDRGWLFENASVPRGKGNPVPLPLSIILHVALIGAFVMVPILTSQDRPDVHGGLDGILVVPTIPPPPAPPGPGHGGDRNTTRTTPQSIKPTTNVAVVPTKVIDIGDLEQLDIRPTGGPGGVDGGFDDPTRSSSPFAPIVGGILKHTSEPDNIYQIAGGNIKPPKRIHYVAPIYPNLARRAGVQGTVVVNCVIDSEGRVVNAQVVKSLPLLGDAAIQAVRQWIYNPSFLNGVPISVSMDVSVVFLLQR